MPAPKSPTEVGLYLPPEVLRLSQYPMTTRIILAEVLSLAATGKPCTPSNPHFTRRFGYSPDTVGRALRGLAADGLLVIDQDPQSGHNRVLTPTLSPPDPPQNAAGTLPQNAAPHLPQNAEANPPQNAARRRKKPEGVPQNAEGASAKSRTQANSRREKGKEHPPVAAARPVRGRASPSSPEQPFAADESAAPPTPVPPAGPDGFDAFYAAWPTKQKRRDAAKAFAALPHADQQLAAERAAKWIAEHPRLIQRGSCPYPASWLRGAMWDDGPEPPDRSPKPGQPAATPTSDRTNATKILARQQSGKWE